MKLPDYPVEGGEIPASWGRQVVDFLRSLTPRPSPDVLPSWSPNGTSWSALRRARAPAARGQIAPWQVSAYASGGAFKVACAGGRFVARLAGATVLVDDVEEDADLAGPVDGHSVYLLYRHRGLEAEAPEISLEYGALPDETAEEIPIEIARTTANGALWDVDQFAGGIVTIEDAHRGQVKMWTGDAADIPEFWEVIGSEGHAVVSAGETRPVNTTGGDLAHAHKMAETNGVTFGHQPSDYATDPPRTLRGMTMEVEDVGTGPADPAWFAVYLIKRQ